jgi:RNA polymerase sigma-70 factor, ECF subfamily
MPPPRRARTVVVSLRQLPRMGGIAQADEGTTMDARAPVDEASGTTAADLLRLADGDSSVLSTIYDGYASAVFGVALRVTGDRSAAEDVVQETFVGVWRNAARFDPARASFRTWVLTIAHHRAVDAVRRRRGIERSIDQDEVFAATFAGPVDVWHEVSARLDATEVRERLAALPAAQRECIELAYFEGLTHVEIAARTGLPLGTIKSRVRNGLLRLRAATLAAAPIGRHVPPAPRPTSAFFPGAG